MPPANLIIADPNQLIRLGLTSVFRYVKKIDRVFGEAATGEELTRVVRGHAPGLVLMSDRLPNEDSFDVMRTLFAIHHDIKVVLVGSDECPKRMALAAINGAQGYVSEGATGRQIRAAVKDTIAGVPPFPTSVFGAIVSALREQSPAPSPQISPVECRVLRHIAFGLSNEMIAQSMGMSHEAIKYQLRRLRRRTGLKRRGQLTLWAVREGLVPGMP